MGAVHQPQSLEALQESVRSADRLRVLGSGHSFVPLWADAGDSNLSLGRLRRGVELDAATGVAHVDGGSTYAELAAAIRGTGWTLPNAHSLPHTTVAGTVATGSHGSSCVDRATGHPPLPLVG